MDHLNFKVVEVGSLQSGSASLVRDTAVLACIVQTCPFSEECKPANSKFSNLSYIVPLMDLLFQFRHFTFYFEDEEISLFHCHPLGLGTS